MKWLLLRLENHYCSNMQRIIPKGVLIPIGGNEDKGATLDERETQDFIEEGILAHVVKESGGIHASIIVIPTASSIPLEVGENYLEAFGKIGCTHVRVLDIRSKQDCEKEEVIQMVSKTDCIMFSGGDQSKITDRIAGTSVHRIILDRYHNEPGFVVAGTSAGAMAMSSYMIAGGSSTEAFVKGAVDMYRGLGLIPQLIIDTHFIQRGRFGRVAEAIAIHPELIGVGLAEDTGLIIRNGNDVTVIGSGMVIIFDGQHIKHNKQGNLEEGTPMTLTNVIVHILSNSDRFDIAKRKVHVLPIDASFI